MKKTKLLIFAFTILNTLVEAMHFQCKTLVVLPPQSMIEQAGDERESEIVAFDFSPDSTSCLDNQISLSRAGRRN